uniref:Uncharacterized protein n=1 Tax=Cacopsylla melanoneura TaxID=428564 RepID=A0A8D9BBE1_9HEMI
MFGSLWYRLKPTIHLIRHGATLESNKFISKESVSLDTTDESVKSTEIISEVVKSDKKDSPLPVDSSTIPSVELDSSKLEESAPSADEINVAITTTINIDDNNFGSTATDIKTSASKNEKKKKTKYRKYSPEKEDQTIKSSENVKSLPSSQKRFESPKRGEEKQSRKSTEKEPEQNEPASSKGIEKVDILTERMPKDPKSEKSTDGKFSPKKGVSFDSEGESLKSETDSKSTQKLKKKPKSSKDPEFQPKSDKNAVAEFISKESTSYQKKGTNFRTKNWVKKLR